MKLATTGMLGVLALVAPAPSRGEAERTLYFFFSPDSLGQEELARNVVEYVRAAKGAVKLRSVLLVGDFAALGKVQDPSPFTTCLKEMVRLTGGPLDLSLYDEEGLALARAWQIKRLPALVLVSKGRAHVAMGSRARPHDLEECRP
jgi:hypothetical protein